MHVWKKKINRIKKNRKRGGEYVSILKGSNNYGATFDGQTPSEISQFGILPGNDWASSLGQNPGVTAQMQADASGAGQAGGAEPKQYNVQNDDNTGDIFNGRYIEVQRANAIARTMRMLFSGDLNEVIRDYWTLLNTFISENRTSLDPQRYNFGNPGGYEGSFFINMDNPHLIIYYVPRVYAKHK